MKLDTEAIIDIIAERADIREVQAREHLNQLIEVIRTETATGGEYEIEGFGTFYREDQKLQFQPSGELRAELNYQYAGMEPIEISETDLSVSTEEDRVEEDEYETRTPESDKEGIKPPETQESKYTEVDDVFGLGPQQEEEMEDEEPEDEEEMDVEKPDEEGAEKESAVDSFSSSRDEEEITEDITVSAEGEVDETHEDEEEDEELPLSEKEDAALEDEIASELYTTRESPIEDIEQLVTGLKTKLHPLGSLKPAERDRDDAAIEPDSKEEQAEIRDPSAAFEEPELETESDSEPVEKSPEEELDQEELDEEQSEEDIFNLEQEEEEEFDFSDIEDEPKVAETDETDEPDASGRPRRKRRIGLRRWFNRLNEQFPVFPVFLISLTIVIMGFAFWMVLNPDLRNNMMQQVEGYLPTGKNQAKIEQSPKPPTGSANKKSAGAAGQKHQGKADDPKGQKAEVGQKKKGEGSSQQNQPTEVADPYGLEGDWHQQGKSYTLIISSFRKRSNAGDLHNRMQQQGYRTHIQRTRVNGRTFFRVAVGQFQTIGKARRGAEQLPASFQEAYFIRRISNN